MAYNEEKLTKLKALKQLAQKVDENFAKKESVSAAINAKLSSTYKAGGGAAFADLPELTEANLGLVVNMTEAFTTTENFVEGADKQYPAGTNVAVVQSGEDYKYDVLAGFVDLSGYVEKEDGKGLSSNDFTAAEKAKLAGLENIITNAITAMDDNFMNRYGVTAAEGEATEITFEFPGFDLTQNVSASDSIQDVIDKLSATLDNEGLRAACDAASGELVVTSNSGEPVEITIKQGDTVLSYTPGERVGPMFSFNGRSGQVVPKAGDYTPEMIGLSVASDEDVTEMLAEVFGAAE